MGKHFHFITMLLAFLLLPSISSATYVWNSEVVSNPYSAAGLYSDAAIGSNGKVHSTFHQGLGTYLGGPLIYSTNASDVWVNTTIHNSGRQSRIAIDSLGYIHIVFYSGYNLYYASNRSGSWINQLIEYTLGEIDLVKPSIHIDGNGFAHVVYYSGDWILSSVNIRYANNVSGAWQVETIESLGKLVQWGGSDAPMFVSAINLDSLGNPRVVYLNKNRDIALTTRSTSGWSTSTVAVRPTSGLTWMDLSLTLSNQGKVHAAYQRVECYAGCIEAGIGYATNDSGAWIEEVVNDNVFITNSDSTGLINPSIVLDLNNQPHISYIHYNYRFFGSLMTQRTITHSRKVGAIWRTSLPIKQLQINNTPSSFKGYSTSIATATNGIPSITYYNNESESLDIATASKVSSPLINIFNTPNSSDFGSLEMEQSATRSVTIQNLGTLPLNISNISLTHLEGTGFTVDLLNGPSACALTSFTLSSNTSCSFSINYKASQLGSASTIVQIDSNDPDLPSLINTFSASTIEQSTPTTSGASGGGCISNPTSMTYSSWLIFGFLTFGLWAYRKRYN